MTNYTHIQGNTLQLYFQVIDLQPGENVAGSTGRAQVRTKCGQLVEELVFAWVNDGVDFTLISQSDTSAWPTGTLCFDVRFYFGNGDNISSDVGEIVVSNGITQ